MKKHAILSIIVIAILLIIPVVVNASSFLTMSFGGKVSSTSMSLVTCTGSGTGPVTLTKIKGLSYYTESSSKTPSVNDLILGRYNIIPNFSTCKIQVGNYKIPYPVYTTSNYNISGNSY